MDINERLRKIKAIVDRGEAGEREAALAIYERLKTLYGLSDKDIADGKLSERAFIYKTVMQRRLLCQVIYMVCGNVDMYGEPGHRAIMIQCTNTEFEEIQLYYSIYKAAFQKQLDTFYTAFLMKNGIYPDAGVRFPVVPSNEPLTDKERAAQRLLAGIERVERPRALLEASEVK